MTITIRTDLAPDDGKCLNLEAMSGSLCVSPLSEGDQGA
jgi:hypothetical protein